MPENHGVRDQLRGLVQKLKQVPRHAQAPPPPSNGNGNGNGNGHRQQPDGPQAILSQCRELAMQVKVSIWPRFLLLVVVHFYNASSVADAASLAKHVGQQPADRL